MRAFPVLELFGDGLLADWGVGHHISLPEGPVADWEFGDFPKGPKLTLLEKIVGDGFKLRLEMFLGWGPSFMKGWTGCWELGGFLKRLSGWKLGLGLKIFLDWKPLSAHGLVAGW